MFKILLTTRLHSNELMVIYMWLSAYILPLLFWLETILSMQKVKKPFTKTSNKQLKYLFDRLECCASWINCRGTSWKQSYLVLVQFGADLSVTFSRNLCQMMASRIQRLARLSFVNAIRRKSTNLSVFLPKLTQRAWYIPLSISLGASAMTFAVVADCDCGII